MWPFRPGLSCGHPDGAGGPVPGTDSTTRDDIASLDSWDRTIVLTITLSDLVGPKAAAGLLHRFKEVARACEGSMVIDLSNVNEMDVESMHSLLALARCLAESQRELAIVSGDGQIGFHLRSSGLDSRLPICRDVPTAVRHLDRSTGGPVNMSL